MSRTRARKIPYENLYNSNKSIFKDIMKSFDSFMQSNKYILGPNVEAFEEEFALFNESKYAVGVSSGFDAILLSLFSLDLPEKSDVLVTSNSYIATILAIIKAGHNPVLVEPEISTYNIDPSELEKKFTARTAALLITHLYGKSCPMDEIISFANKKNIVVVEDCSQAHGTKFKEKKVGNFGIFGCFSLYPTKNLGAFGDAGIITTNNKRLYLKLKSLRNYGSSVKYQTDYLGYNSRLDELQASFLRLKLSKLPSIIAHKRKLATLYHKNLTKKIALPVVDENYFDTFHIFPVRTKKRDLLRKYLSENNVETELHYPVAPCKQKALSGMFPGTYPISVELAKTELSLPISSSTSAADVRYICNLVNNFLK